ncbi:hypothetical protein ACNKHX_16405 [Shigella flexneri]
MQFAWGLLTPRCALPKSVCG